VHARPLRRPPAALLSAALGSLVCLAAIVSGNTDVLCLLPPLLLGCVLFARRYPGERLLARFARRSAGARRPIGPSLAPVGRVASEMPRGGLLMGRSLAVRPPPLALA
jgi:hypothetical protein